MDKEFILSSVETVCEKITKSSGKELENLIDALEKYNAMLLELQTINTEPSLKDYGTIDQIPVFC